MGLLLKRRSLPTAITWTKQSTPSGDRPNPTGYSTDHFSPLLGQAMYYQMPNGSNSIYASDIYLYDAVGNAFSRHPNGNNTMESGQCPIDSPGTGTGRERTIAADGYVWPCNRHPEQTAYDTLRDAYWVYGGVCSNNFEDPAVSAGSIAAMWRLNLNATFADSTWTKLGISTNPAASAGALAQGAEMVHSPVDDVLVLYGAFKTFVFGPTSGSLSAAQLAAGCDTPNEWQDVTPGTVPDAYFYPGLWYELSTQKVILYGGGNSGDNTWYNDIWAYDIPSKTWTNKNPSNPPPAFVGGGGTPPQPPMAYDSRRRLFLYSQLTGSGAPQNWCYDPVRNVWTELTANDTPNPDGSVDGFSMTYDSVNDKFIAVVYNPSSDPTNNPSIWHGVWA